MRCVAIVLALIAAAPAARSTTYYVDRSHAQSSDSNSGSESAPWKTIQHAADTMTAGDTVFVKAGTYAERVVISRSGVPGNPIVFSAAGAIIDGSGVEVPEYSGLVEIVGASDIRFRGFDVTNSGPHPTSTGIEVDDAAHIVIESNHTSRTSSSGILVWGSTDVIVDGNEVESPMMLGTNSRNECITVGRTSRFEVRNNEVHDNNQARGEGICIKDGSAFGSAHHNHVHHVPAIGIYLDAWTEHTHDIDVYANRVHDIRGNGITCASEQGGLLEHIRVFNNVSYSNTVLGFDLSSCCIASHPMSDIRIVNNSFWNNGVEWGGGLAVDHEQWSGLVIRNNACSGNLSFEMDAEAINLSAAAIDHNLIDAMHAYPGEFCGTDCQMGDPAWAGAASADFHLMPHSIAIDHGSSVDAPGVDFEGRPRPHGRAVDIGAFEYAQNPARRRPSRNP